MNINWRQSPWMWVPTLYLAEGLPYFIVNVISVIMFKKMGMGNGEIALYTSLLYLPWVIKPLWSPFVDVTGTKRKWVILTQVLMAASLLFAALSLPKPSPEQIAGGNAPVSIFVVTLVLFYLTAFCSATHDIAADGFYMIALDSHKATLFVGIRSTFYRIASVFGQGVLVVVAGLLETSLNDIPKAWSLTLLLCSAIIAILAFFHMFTFPKCEEKAIRKSASEVFGESAQTFVTFFKKKQVWLALAFMLLYRLPEAFSVKMLNPFLLDARGVGGLGLSTASVGLVYGTVGVIALTIGGILGGIVAARWGLKKALWPMALSLALPCAVYLYMAAFQPESLFVISFCVAFDQFGYGFGFTAYLLYMMYFSEGRFKTSHYSLCTAFMALSMMIPGLVAGYLQEALGYTGFFVMVMLSCIATFAVTSILKIDPSYGKKK